MGKIKDLTGQKFGRLTVIEYVGNKKWKCKCDCGNIVEVKSKSLCSGNTKSCGCYRKERTKELHTKHKGSNTRLYNIYYRMKNRCYYKNDINYKNYGARGIVVCNEWLNDFMNFYNWAMDNGYKEGLTIDRINTDGNYSPDNCKWSTPKQQAQNRRSNKNYTINGETRCLKDWCEILGLNYSTIYARINKQCWPIEKCLQTNKNTV